MKYWLYGVAFFVLVSLVFVSNHAGYLLGQSAPAMLGLEHIRGSLWQGKLLAAPKNPWQPVWLAAEWQWCPGWRPNRWCVDMQGAWGNIQSKVLLGWRGLELHDAQIQLKQLAIPLTPYMQATTDIDAQLEKLNVTYTEDGLQAIKRLQGKAQLSGLNLAGLTLADHQLTLQREPKEDFLLYVEGAQAQGTAHLSNTGNYMADILLTPGKGLEDLLQGQLPKVSEGTFRYQANGHLEGT